MMKLLLCLCVATLAVTASAGEGVCRRSDPALDACLLERATALTPQLAQGWPELGVPSFDPLEVEFMTAEGDMESVRVKMLMKNITLTGHAAAQVTRFKFDPETLSGEVAFTIPLMHMTCDYYATGRLFVIPLESSAHFAGNFTDCDMGLTFRLKTVTRRNVEYFTVDKMAMRMRVDRAHIDLQSLEPERQPAVSVIQDFFNHNDRLVLDTVNALAVSEGHQFYKHVIERALRKIPAENLLAY